MKKIAKKAISIFLAASIAFQLAVSTYAEAGVEFFTDSTLEEEVSLSEENIEERTLIGEIKEKRSEYTKHFLYSDGTIVAAQYHAAVHYLDENGEWQEIDNSLVSQAATKDEDDFAGFTNKSNDFKIKFSNGNASGKFFKYEKDGYKLTWGLSKADLKGKFSVEKQVASEDEQSDYAVKNTKSSVKYTSVMENVDISYEINGSDIKENIIVNDKRSSYSFTFDIKAKKLDLELCDDGSIAITKEDGTYFAHIPAPFMYDSNGEYSSAVSFSLEEYKKDRYYLTVTADEEWMNEEGRQFPVVIDPAIVKEPTISSSTFISSARPNTNFGSWNCYIVGNDEQNGNCRALFEVDLPTLEKSDVIIDAQFSLYQIQNDSESFTTEKIYAYKVNSAWTGSSLTWNERPYFDTTISDYIPLEAKGGTKTINITKMVREWCNGAANYGFVLKSDNEDKSVGSAMFVRIPEPPYTAAMLPYFVVSYRSNKGIEGYWSYHTAGASSAGTAHINDFSGNLVFTNTIVADSGNRMPLSMGIVYDGYRANKQFSFSTNSSNTRFSGMKFGLGWKLSLEECILPVTNAAIAENYKYVYLDSDGTEHYFYKDVDENGKTVYLDEDGLGLTLTVLSNGQYKMTDKGDNYQTFNLSGLLISTTDANGNKLSLTYSNGRITSVTDGAGRKTTLTYNSSGYLTSVKDAASKTTTFTYNSSGYLTKITYPDGTYASYTYSSDGMLLSAQSSEDSYGLHFTYTSAGGFRRVSTYKEKVQTGTSAYASGQSVEIEYSLNDLYTVYTAMGPDNVMNTADDIRTVYIFDDFGRTVSSYSTDKGGKMIYGASTTGYVDGAQKGEVNKISNQSVIGGVNPNLLVGHQCESTTGWTAAYINANNSSMTRAVDANTKFLGAKSIKLTSSSKVSGSLAGYKQSVALEGNTEYVLSAYVRTENISGTGACLAISQQGTTNLYFYSDYATGKTDTSVNNGWQRISISFTTSGAGTWDIYFGLKECTGTAYFDCLQLEKSKNLSNVNLLENAGMESKTKWTAQCDSTVSAGLQGSGITIKGNPVTSFAVYQDVPLNTPAKTTFVLSGWAKADSVPIRNSRRLGLSARITYTDGTTETHYADFLSSTSEWQFTSANIVPKKELDIKSIRVYCNYNYNCNTATFDNISLIKDTVQSYVYDENGNVTSAVDNAQSESTFAYQNNDLVKQNNPTGGSYNYTYDEKHNLMTALSENKVEYSFFYDAYGNPESMTQSNASNSLKYTSFATYTSDGNYLATMMDPRNNTTKYDYLLDSGLLLNQIDPLGNKTIYAYKTANKRLTGVAYDANKNDMMDANESAVYYNYANGRLSTIKHNDFSYGFTYDNFGNMLTTTVGGNALVTNTYQSGNGNLTKSVYGNGHTVKYLYDDLNRVSSIQQGTKQSTRYEYDNNGNVIEINDRANNTLYNYEYDLVGRLIRSFVTKNSANYLTTQVSYDNFNRISAQKYILADGTSQNYSYTYKKDNLVNTITLPYSRKLIYNHDSLNRPTAKTITGGTAAITENYTYLSASGASTTTPLISKIAYSDGKSLQYGYNGLNNITSIKDENGKQITYQYDGLGQLIRENNPYNNRTYVYSYDKGGNITSVKAYAYTTSSTLGAVLSTTTYTYGDSAWKDKLTNYNGTAITYDAIGNPLKYRNGTLSWQNGRQLATFVNTSGTTTAYIYNADGVRVGKSGSKNVSYTVSGTQILSETSGGETIYYIYDDNGLPIGLKYKGNVYTYRKNLQGDIIGILDSTGKEVVYYRYNAWGVVTSMGGSAAGTVGQANPFRYRGYYYDFESGYYYLNSRYYDPTTGRFINADTTSVLTASPMALTDKNLFAYCDNNPVMRVDVGGDFWFVSVIVGLATQYVGDVVGNIMSGKTGLDILKPTSSVGEYIAAGVTALIPGTGIAGALTRNVVTEAITVTEDVILGNEVNIVESLVNVGVGTVLDAGFEKVADKATDYISSKAPKNYSSHAYSARVSKPYISRQEIYRSMRRSIRHNRFAQKAVSFGIDSLRSSLPY